MKINNSHVCLDCDEIFVLNRRNGYTCPGCGGGHFWSMERFVGRMVDTETKGKEKDRILEGVDMWLKGWF